MAVKFDLKKFAQVVSLIGPGILPAVAVPAEITNAITQEIIIAQSIPGAKGVDKRNKVVSGVEVGGHIFELFKGKNVIDEAQIAHTVGVGIDTVIEAVKTVENIPLKPAA